MKDVFKKIIVETQELVPFELFNRSFEVFSSSAKISAFIGLRRVGKTHLLYQVMNSLVNKKDKLIFVNFEDDRLSDLSLKDLDFLLDAYYELFPANTDEKLYFFFDEVQAVLGWEKFVNRLFERKHKVFVTGSNSKLLSKELATVLRGRALSVNVFPLCFKEFLGVNSFVFSDKSFFSNDRFKIKSFFNDFLIWGGFFEVVNSSNELEKRKVIETYVDLIVYKDLVERYDIKNLDLVKFLIRYFSTNLGCKISLNKLYNLLSSKMRVSKDSIFNYTSLLTDIGFLYRVNKFGFSLKSTARSKYYLVDNGFKTVHGLNFTLDKGSLLEAVVLQELVMRGFEVSYFEDKFECDFIAKKNELFAIQVCWDLDVSKDREVRGLLEALNKLDLNSGLILTNDFDGEEIIDGKRVVYKSVWKWLLDSR